MAGSVNQTVTLATNSFRTCLCILRTRLLRFLQPIPSEHACVFFNQTASFCYSFLPNILVCSSIRLFRLAIDSFRACLFFLQLDCYVLLPIPSKHACVLFNRTASFCYSFHPNMLVCSSIRLLRFCDRYLPNVLCVFFTQADTFYYQFLPNVLVCSSIGLFRFATSSFSYSRGVQYITQPCSNVLEYSHIL